MMLFVFLVSTMLSCFCCSAQKNKTISLPDDNKNWETLFKVMNASGGGRSSDDSLSVFDRILLANAEARGEGRSGSSNYLFQGDILMDKKAVIDMISGGSQRRKRAVMKKEYSRRLWKKNIPYALSNTLGDRAVRVIGEAIKDWEETLPCLGTWRKITNCDDLPKSDRCDYIRFIKGNGCYSRIGRVGGRQEISIGNRCDYRGIVIHEIGHAMGFWHEQSRTDRDNYVKIQWDNIIDGMEFNFKKYSSARINDLGVPYDYGSIMHYGSTAFAKRRGLVTIKVIGANKDVRLGQRNALSPKDKQQAQLLYGCKVRKSVCDSSPCLNNGKCDDDDNKFKCTCIAPYTGDRCEQKVCGDSNSKCPAWANAGFCEDKTYEDYMQKTCCKACRLNRKVSTTVRPSPCDSSPCLNNGVCSNKGSTFSCICPSSHTGVRCEQKVSCKDGRSACGPWARAGYCEHRLYKNYMQSTCCASCRSIRIATTVRPLPCDSSPCLNNGVCSNKGSTFSCKCPSSHTGGRCEKKVVDCKDKNQSCRVWKQLNFCTGVYEAYMKKNCAKSCGHPC